MTTRPTDPYDTVVVTMANITMLRVIKEARKVRNDRLHLANVQRDAAIQRANELFIQTICNAAVDMDSSILAIEDDGQDNDDDDDE